MRKAQKNPAVMVLAFLFLTGTRASGEDSSQSNPNFSHELYSRILKTHVDGQGLVNYKKLKASRKDLDTHLREMARVDPKTYQSWPEKEKLSFLINAYNAMALQAIIDNYPIRSSFFKSLRFPKNSIRQISGVWAVLSFIGKYLNETNSSHLRKGNYSVKYLDYDWSLNEQRH